MEADTGKLHVAMLPWLAIGHLLPFFELSKLLALKGHTISFFSTPSNILRLPPIPQTLTPFFHFIPCSPSSAINNVVDNTVDLRSDSDRPLLNQTYQHIQNHLIAFLSDPCRPKPNWIIYDFPGDSWVPALASQYGLKSALFVVVNAAAFSFIETCLSDSLEKLTKPPDFTPFPTNLTLRPFEAREIIRCFYAEAGQAESRKRTTRLLLIRTFRELEGNWVDTLGENCCPVGFLHSSSSRDENEEESEAGARISEWLDKQDARSVIYASFGSEAILTREQIDEIAVGLETAGSPFVWVLRVGSPPVGFEDRTAGRGMVWMGWVPQARLVAHSAIGGFLTQGGWNSAVQGMALGLPLVVLPMVFEQGLTARHLAETGYAVEIARDDEDGRFDGEEIARKLKMVMVDEEGEEMRKKARQGKEIFGSEKLQDEYIVELVKILWETRMTLPEPA